MGLSFGANRRELYIDNRSNDTRADIVFRTVQGQSDPTEKLRITSGGNIGIGNTDTPQSLLEVFGTSPIIRSKHSTSHKYTQINHNGTDGYVDWSSGGLIFRGASNTERLRILSDGKVGIGTDNPEYQTTIAADGANAKLNIKRKTAASSNGNAFGSLFYTNSDGTDVASIRAHRESANDDAYLGFATRNTGGSLSERLRIDSAGRMLLGTATEGSAEADTFTIAESGSAGMTIRSGTAARGSIFFSDGTSGVRRI